MVEEAALTVGGDDERALVVGGIDGEPLRQTTTPGPLLTHGTMAWARNHVVDLLDGFQPVGGHHASAHHHIFVGEGHQRPVVGLCHQALHDLIALAVALHAHQPDEYAWGAADAFERGEREPHELAGIASGGAEHPLFLRFRQHPNVEGTPHRCHLIEIAIGERRTVPGFHLELHCVKLPCRVGCSDSPEIGTRS
ncbi:MAG TPA: hypothetical protein DCR14_05605 [Acidimicrobiaceae bacterium]|nr:hypothetical protein [Acidimicrobiaceae bacterium]